MSLNHENIVTQMQPTYDIMIILFDYICIYNCTTYVRIVVYDVIDTFFLQGKYASQYNCKTCIKDMQCCNHSTEVWQQNRQPKGHSKILPRIDPSWCRLAHVTFYLESLKVMSIQKFYPKILVIQSQER